MKEIFEAVDRYRASILQAQNTIWANPETGYKEFKTSAYLEAEFEKLGYTLVRAGDIPGFYTVLDTGRPGPEILILGELDALICRAHPDADPETGAVHCCGHSAQCAALLGIAAALKQPFVTDGWCGRIRLCAVPAEELIELEYRSDLRKKGTIRYFGGKTEFLHRGYFDGADIAFMVHTSGKTCKVYKGAVGMIAKRVIFKGVSAHAGGAPWEGCNALYAAALGLQAVNAIRETFEERDLIRVHPILTAGGTAVNAIPEKAVLETFVRGKTYEAIEKTNKKVNRALCGAALSMGAHLEIEDMPGYAPLINDDELTKVAEEAAAALPNVSFKISDKIGTGSTDMGDLCSVMPVVHPYMPGAVGTGHGADFYIADPESACVGSAKWQLAMLDVLLCDDGKRAKAVIERYKPLFPSRDAFFAYIDSFFASGERLAYEEDRATVKL